MNDLLAVAVADWKQVKMKRWLSSAADSMQHGEWLMQRIIVPAGAPMVVTSSSMKKDRTPPQMVTIDRFDERDGMFANNTAIRPAQEADDQVAAELLKRILLMEEGHLD